MPKRKSPSKSKVKQLFKKFYNVANFQIGGNSPYPKIFEGDSTLIASQKKCGIQNGSGCPTPLYVKKNNHKGIILGKEGSKIKDIGIASRKDIEKILGKKIFLSLDVKVDKNWDKDPNYYSKLGLEMKKN